MKQLIHESVQRDLLIYAFRYALGRRSYAVADVANVLRRAWPELSHADKHLYKLEIREAITRDCAGDDQDIKTWQALLELDEANNDHPHSNN